MARTTAAINRKRRDYLKTENESLDLYFEEINRIPLIKQPEEIELAKRNQAGDEQALQKLVTANLRFVVNVAKKYRNQGLSFADLINEGNIGLIKAARRFDPYYRKVQKKGDRKSKQKKPVKLISYAVWWIRQAILQALADSSRAVRLPLNRAGEIYEIGQKKAKLAQELDRTITVEDVIRGLPDKNPLDIIEALNFLKAPLSLDGPVGGQDKSESSSDKLYDILNDPTARNAEDDYSDGELKSVVDEVLAGLAPREEEVIRLYFGWNGDKPMTLEEIGEVFDLTRERIRQIKHKALRRLRHSSRRRKLAEFHYS